MRNTSWFVRGITLAIVHFSARLVLSLMVLHVPSFRFFETTVAVAIVVLVALVWGGLDGIVDSRSNGEPRDLLMIWLQAGLFAAIVSGIATWILNQVVDFGVSTLNLVGELSAGLAATALLIFLPATVGFLVGKPLGRRSRDGHSSIEAVPTPDDGYANVD